MVSTVGQRYNFAHAAPPPPISVKTFDLVERFLTRRATVPMIDEQGSWKRYRLPLAFKITCYSVCLAEFKYFAAPPCLKPEAQI